MGSAYDVLLPQDYGRIETCRWLVTRIIDDLESHNIRPTVEEIQSSLDEQISHIQRRKKGRDFFFTLGYEETLDSSLSSMVHLGILRIENSEAAYFLTDAGRDILRKQEDCLRKMGYTT
jgi:hypothetical protein